MAVDMMVPLTSEPWAPVTVMNNKEYYSFYVNIYNDTFTETKKHLIIPSEQPITQENLRQILVSGNLLYIYRKLSCFGVIMASLVIYSCLHMIVLIY